MGRQTSVVSASGGHGGYVLTPGEVTVWSYSLDAPSAILEQCRSWLSADEMARAGRFVSGRDRDRFVVAHGGLRDILGRYVSKAPATLRFHSSPTGKPMLYGEEGASLALNFNLSHSNGRCVIALAAGIQVGVDMELIRQDVDGLKLANRFFAPAEHRAVAAAESAQQAATFFRYWVAKEAFLKFKGVGLQFPLERCRIAVSSDIKMATVDWTGTPDSVEQGLVRYLSLSDGWIGAVAAEGNDWAVRLGEWSLG